MLFQILILIVVAFIVLLIIGFSNSAKAGHKAKKIIQQIDKKYNAFIEKKMTLAVIKKDDFEYKTADITKEAVQVVKPELESLISYILATKNASGISINYHSPYFANLVSLAEKYFRITEEKKLTELSEEEEKEFYEAIETGIQSDLTTRIINIQSGDF